MYRKRFPIKLSRNIKWRPILLLLAVIAINNACSNIGVYPTCGQSEHHLFENPVFHPLWVKSTYVMDGEFDPTIQGVGGLVFVATQDLNYGSPRIMALDTLTGNMLWQQKVDLPVSMLVSDDSLYIGENDAIPGYVPETGSKSRQVVLSNVGPIHTMYFADHTIFAVTSNDNTIIYEVDSGKVTLSKFILMSVPFMIENGILYTNDNQGIKAIETKTQKILWTYAVNGEFYTKPLFTLNTMILLTQLGNIYAINKQTGVLMWKLNAHAISNVATDETDLYFLSQDGYIGVVDEKSGRELSRGMLSSAPFHVSTSDAIVGGYNVLVDSQNKILIVSLGDSCQLIALKIQNH